MIKLKIGSLVLCKLLTPTYEDRVEAYGIVQGVGSMTLTVKFYNNNRLSYVDRSQCKVVTKRIRHGTK